MALDDKVHLFSPRGCSISPVLHKWCTDVMNELTNGGVSFADTDNVNMAIKDRDHELKVLSLRQPKWRCDSGEAGTYKQLVGGIVISYTE